LWTPLSLGRSCLACENFCLTPSNSKETIFLDTTAVLMDGRTMMMAIAESQHSVMFPLMQGSIYGQSFHRP
jgi:hypothetical protein